MPPRRRLEESRKYFEKLHSIYFTSEREKEQPRSGVPRTSFGEGIFRRAM
jgi:hypothetical protein